MTAGQSSQRPVPAFGDRLAAGFDRVGRLCVGVDPHRFLLEEWGLVDDAGGAREFGIRVVEAAAGAALAVKPQVAFFERFGSAGYVALEGVIARAREAGLLVIADAKRGDIGSSVDAYIRAWLDPGSPLESDAVTLSGFQGFGTLAPALADVAGAGKGAFVLVAMSNPEAFGLQSARVEGGATVAATQLAGIEDFNARRDGALGPVGAVLGARFDLPDFGVVLDGDPSRTPVLAPGFGHQGARLEDLRALFGRYSPGTIVSESRSLLAAGPGGIARAIRDRSDLIADVLEA